MRTRILVVTLLAVLVSANAFAQAQRTWVSGGGDDMNTCSYGSPCRTFAGAYVKTATGGVISVQDPGPYSGIFISKSITIDGGGTYASVLHTGDGITINFTTTDSFANTVILRGLSFDSPTSTGFGVVVTGSAPTHVHIENSSFGRAGAGVGMFPGGAGSSLKLKNIDIRKMNAYGVAVDPPAGAPLKLLLDDVRISQTAGYGVILFDNVNGTIRDSTFSNNIYGLSIQATSVHANVVRSVLSENTTTGLNHAVAGITTLLDGCSIFGNGTGIANTGSTVIGFSNNSIGNNLSDVTGNAVTSILQQ